MFDEKRYFRAGNQPTVADCRAVRTGLLVCEDLWEPSTAQLARAGGAQLLVVINASPYEIHKQREREEIARAHVAIPCNGSLHWRVSETFEPKAVAAAGEGAYVTIRDTTCRLFGYHGLICGETAFSLDHMFGF